MRRKTKILMNNGSQAVRKQGDEPILSARPKEWSAYLATGPVASEGFMEGIDDLPVQEREPSWRFTCSIRRDSTPSRPPENPYSPSSARSSGFQS